MAPNCFTLVINETHKGLDFCFVYLDISNIYSETDEQHLDHIRQVFDRLQKVNVKLKMIKSKFFKHRSIIFAIHSYKI